MRFRGVAAKPYIAALIFDDYNAAEMARHHVSPRELQQLISNRHVTADNPRGAPGSILLIGHTDSGRLLTVPLVPTNDPGTWRPATAFAASRHQRTLFRRRTR